MLFQKEIKAPIDKRNKNRENERKKM